MNMLTVPHWWQATRQKPGATEGGTWETRMKSVEPSVRSSLKVCCERFVCQQIDAVEADVPFDDLDLDTSKSCGFQNSFAQPELCCSRKVVQKRQKFRLPTQEEKGEQLSCFRSPAVKFRHRDWTPVLESWSLPSPCLVRTVDTVLPDACPTGTSYICELCPPGTSFLPRGRRTSHHQNSS